MKVLNFSNPSSVEGWIAIDDRVMGGMSSSRLRFHPDGHAVFEGDVPTANGGGFASVRHNALRLGCQGTEGYRLHVRGDGKRFKLNLRMEDVSVASRPLLLGWQGPGSMCPYARQWTYP